MKLFRLTLGLMVMLLPFTLRLPAQAAEYQGRNLDGTFLNARLFSYSNLKYYEVVMVVFERNQATLYLKYGDRFTATLSKEQIDRLSDIPAYTTNGNAWRIEILPER